MELAKSLSAVAKKMGVSFVLKGRPLSFDEVFSDTGMLPGLAKRADQLASLCLGYGIGVSYEDAEKSLLGKKVKFDEFTPDILRLMTITDVMFELTKNSPDKTSTSLDELMYD